MQASGNHAVDNSPRSSPAARGKNRRLPRAFSNSKRAFQLWLRKLKMRILTIIICLRPSEKNRPPSRSQVARSATDHQEPSSLRENLNSTEQFVSPEVVNSLPSRPPETSTASHAGRNIVKKDSSESRDRVLVHTTEGVTSPVLEPPAEKRVVGRSVLQGYPGDKLGFECLPRIKRNKHPAASHQEDETVSCLPCCRKSAGVGLEEVNSLLREKKARGRVNNNLIAWKKEDRERAKRVALRCRTSLGLYDIRDLGQDIAQGLEGFVWARPEVMLYDFDTSTHAYITSCYAKRPNLHWAMQKPILEDETLWRNSLRAYNMIRKKTYAHKYKIFDDSEGHFLPTRNEGPTAAEGSSKLSRGRPTVEHQGKTKSFGTPMSQLRRQQQTASRTGKHDGTRPVTAGNFYHADRDPSPSSSSFQSQPGYPVRQVPEKHWNELGNQVAGHLFDARAHSAGQLSKSSSPRSSGQGHVYFQTNSQSPRASPRTPGVVHNRVDVGSSSARPVSHTKPKHQPANRSLLAPVNVNKPLREGKGKQSIEMPVAKRIVLRAPKHGGTPDITLKKLYLVGDTPRNKVKTRRLTKARAQQKPKRLSIHETGTKREDSISSSKKGKGKNEDPSRLAKEKRSESSESGKRHNRKLAGNEDSQVTPEQAGKPSGEDKLMPYDLDAVAAQLKDEPVIVMNVNSPRMGSIVEKCCGDRDSQEPETPQNPAKSQWPKEPNFSKDRGAKEAQPPSSKSSATWTETDTVEETNLSEDTEAKEIQALKTPSSTSSETDTEPMEETNSSIIFSEANNTLPSKTSSSSSKSSLTSTEHTEGTEDTNLLEGTEAKDRQRPETPSSKSYETGTISSNDREAKDTEPRKTPWSNASETGTELIGSSNAKTKGTPYSGEASSTRERMDTNRAEAAPGNQDVGHTRSFSGGSYNGFPFLAGDVAYAESLEKSGTESPTQTSTFTWKKPKMKDESIQVDLQRPVSVKTQSRASSALRPPQQDEQTQFSSRSVVAEQNNLDLYSRPVARPSMNDNGIPFSKPGLYQVLEPKEDAFGGKVLATSLTKRASITEETSQKHSLDDDELPPGITSTAGASPSPERTMSISSSTSEASIDHSYTSEENGSSNGTGDTHSSHGRLSRHDLKPRVIVRSSIIVDGKKGFSGHKSVHSSRILDGIEDADLEGATTGRKRSSGIRIHSFLKSMAQRSGSVELNNLILEELARANPALMEKLGYKENPDPEERKSSLSTMSSAPEDSSNAGEGNHPGTPASGMSDRTALSSLENTSSANRDSLDESAEEPSLHGIGGTVGPTVDGRKSPDRVVTFSSGNSDRQSVIGTPPTSDENSAGSVSSSLLSELQRCYPWNEDLMAKTPEEGEQRKGSSFPSHSSEDSSGGRMAARRSRVIMRSSIILGGIKDIKDFGPWNRPVRSSRILDVSGIEDSDLERIHRKRSHVRIHSFLHSMTHRHKSLQLNNLILEELAKNPALRDRIALQSDSEERKSSLSAMSASLDNEDEDDGNTAPDTSAFDTSRRTSESPSESLSWMDGDRTPSLSSGRLLDAETFADQILSLSSQVLPEFLPEFFPAKTEEGSYLQNVAGRSRTPGAVVPTESMRKDVDPPPHLQDPLLEQAGSPRNGKIRSIFQTMISARGAESGESEEVTGRTKQEHRSDQLETRNVASSSNSGNQGNQILEMPIATTSSEHNKIRSLFNSMTSGSSPEPDNLISSQLNGDGQASANRSHKSDRIVESRESSQQESTSQADEMNLVTDDLATSSHTAAFQDPEEMGSLALSEHQLIASSQQSSEISSPPLWMERWKSDRFADFPPAPLPSVSRNDGEDSPPPTPSSGLPSTPPHQVEFLQAFWKRE